MGQTDAKMPNLRPFYCSTQKVGVLMRLLRTNQNRCFIGFVNQSIHHAVARIAINDLRCSGTFLDFAFGRFIDKRVGYSS